MDDKSKTTPSSNSSVSMLSLKDDKSNKDDSGKDGKSDLDKLGSDKGGSIPPKGIEDSKESSSHSDSAKDNNLLSIGGIVSGDKRPREASEEDGSDESLKKKSKKDENLTGTSSSATLASTKPIRGTRGSLSEKIAEKGFKKGRES